MRVAADEADHPLLHSGVIGNRDGGTVLPGCADDVLHLRHTRQELAADRTLLEDDKP